MVLFDNVDASYTNKNPKSNKSKSPRNKPWSEKSTALNTLGQSERAVPGKSLILVV